ncbi:MOSC domain-containing protein, partial [Patescibacteria group bacterium AH-259-L07]|nr:MOSC domain-containing protein [Patescibacteria group bacterium AH-259-L07]
SVKRRTEMKKKGKIAAVCISSKGNVPKYPQEEVQVEQYGFVEDAHAGETRMSHRTKQKKFNDRQISLVAQEVLDSLNQELEISLKPGDLAENITTEGLGDLSDISNRSLLQIGDSVVLEVTEQNNPCKNILIYHRLLVKKIYGRRGIFAVVKQGVGLRIRPGDIIQVL